MVNWVAANSHGHQFRFRGVQACQRVGSYRSRVEATENYCELGDACVGRPRMPCAGHHGHPGQFPQGSDSGQLWIDPSLGPPLVVDKTKVSSVGDQVVETGVDTFAGENFVGADW